MPERILVLGAGFGGLELATTVSEALGDDVDVTLIDHGDGFVFGYSKLDIMFGGSSIDAVKLPYSAFVKPGVRLLRETILAIYPEAHAVMTDQGTHEGDHLVIALGADYDFDATPGLAGANEFYSVEGAMALAGPIQDFREGRVVVGVCSAPFKCPPAPSEAALLMHDHLERRGVREACEIVLTMPLPSPVPPSPDTSEALLEAFTERGIEYRPSTRMQSIDPQKRLISFEGGNELSYDLLLGVPRHRAPDVVLESGIAVDGYIPVDSPSLRTAIPDVYAIGDVATAGVPKAGIFAEGAGRAVARQLIAKTRGGAVEPYDGLGACYIEFGAGRIGRVDIDFLSGPRPTGAFREPSPELRIEKDNFGSLRRARWFGL